MIMTHLKITVGQWKFTFITNERQLFFTNKTRHILFYFFFFEGCVSILDEIYLMLTEKYFIYSIVWF